MQPHSKIHSYIQMFFKRPLLNSALLIGLSATIYTLFFFQPKTLSEEKISDIISTLNRADTDYIIGEAIVIDGNRLGVGGYAVRLEGVGAYHETARSHIQSLVENHTVWCHLDGFDPAGFALGTCSTLGSADIGAKLLHAGLAEAMENEDYSVIEHGARIAQAGQW